MATTLSARIWPLMVEKGPRRRRGFSPGRIARA
jgi:hypothetical protein